jgi:hypothetical protein
MTAHELMIKINHHLIKGGTLTNGQKYERKRRTIIF